MSADPLAQVSRGAPREETSAVYVLTLVQFVHVTDSIVGMPLGADLAKDLAIPSASLGWVYGSYSLGATLAGLAGLFLLDRLPRQRLLTLTLMGVALTTVLTGFAVGLSTMILTRLLAGLFGGFAGAAALAMLADAVPVVRRGRAMGFFLSAYSFALTLGMPLALEVARRYSWRDVFWSLGLLAAVAAVLTRVCLPARPAPVPAKLTRSLVNRGETWLGWAAIFFIVVPMAMHGPNLAVYVQRNLGFPRDRLHLLYILGGAVSLLGMRAVGWATDRFGSVGLTFLAAAVTLLHICMAFYASPPPIPAWLITSGFYLTVAMRQVPTGTLLSRIPAPDERGSFNSVLSIMQQAGLALGASMTAVLLRTGPRGELLGYPLLSVLSLIFVVVQPLLVWQLARRGA